MGTQINTLRCARATAQPVPNGTFSVSDVMLQPAYPRLRHSRMFSRTDSVAMGAQPQCQYTAAGGFLVVQASQVVANLVWYEHPAERFAGIT